MDQKTHPKYLKPRKIRSLREQIGEEADLGAGKGYKVAGIKGDDGGGGSTELGHERGDARLGRREEERENRRAKPLGAGFIRPPRGHRTLLMWHRTRPVTTGLMRREGCKFASHWTMGTGHWL